MSGSRPAVRGGEYAARGDYHRTPDPSWDYYPTYIAKLEAVRRWLDALPPARASSTPAAAKASSSTSSPARLAIEGLDQQLLVRARPRRIADGAALRRTAASIARSASTCSST